MYYIGIFYLLVPTLRLRHLSQSFFFKNGEIYDCFRYIFKNAETGGAIVKILAFSWEYPPRVVGGLARHVQELYRAMAKYGDEVHVITCGPKKTTRSATIVELTSTG